MSAFSSLAERSFHQAGAPGWLHGAIPYRHMCQEDEERLAKHELFNPQINDSSCRRIGCLLTEVVKNGLFLDCFPMGWTESDTRLQSSAGFCCILLLTWTDSLPESSTSEFPKCRENKRSHLSLVNKPRRESGQGS